MDQNTNHEWIWLSHVLNENTPTYNNQSKVTVSKKSSILDGQTSNSSILSFSSHDGTHVDAPFHFFQNGNSIDSYQANNWIFNNPLVLKAKYKVNELIQLEDISLPHDSKKQENDIDLILIKTDFETKRDNDVYWKENPGISKSLAQWILSQFPKIRAIGVDLISVSNLLHRNEGRKVHKILLGKNILIFEDLLLKEINNILIQVIALPIRYSKGDGSPCTIIGKILRNG